VQLETRFDFGLAAKLSCGLFRSLLHLPTATHDVVARAVVGWRESSLHAFSANVGCMVRLCYTNANECCRCW
jgi:hypothetical protein